MSMGLDGPLLGSLPERSKVKGRTITFLQLLLDQVLSNNGTRRFVEAEAGIGEVIELVREGDLQLIDSSL